MYSSRFNTHVAVDQAVAVVLTKKVFVMRAVILLILSARDILICERFSNQKARSFPVHAVDPAVASQGEARTNWVDVRGFKVADGSRRSNHTARAGDEESGEE